jgi:hypothetical protein
MVFWLTLQSLVHNASFANANIEFGSLDYSMDNLGGAFPSTEEGESNVSPSSSSSSSMVSEAVRLADIESLIQVSQFYNTPIYCVIFQISMILSEFLLFYVEFVINFCCFFLDSEIAAISLVQ